MKAIRFHETGGPEVLRLEDVELPGPAAGEVRIRHTAIGINYIDTYHRSGLYPMKLPSGLGLEAAGVVEALGDGVSDLKIGDRVAYGNGPLGAYAEAINAPAARVSKIPDGVSNDIAASIMLKGLTSEYLVRRTYPVKPGDWVLFHAAAGGVGQIACQWAKALGAIVIGTVGSDAKVETAKANGCDHVIVSTKEDVAARVLELTGGVGVPVSYDGVGKDTFDISLKALKPRGMFVSFGNASGAVPPFPATILSPKSLYFTRPTLGAYAATAAELREASDALFAVIASGDVKVAAPTVYALKDAADAHRDLQARKTTGSLILRP